MDLRHVTSSLRRAARLRDCEVAMIPNCWPLGPYDHRHGSFMQYAGHAGLCVRVFFSECAAHILRDDDFRAKHRPKTTSRSWPPAATARSWVSSHCCCPRVRPPQGTPPSWSCPLCLLPACVAPSVPRRAAFLARGRGSVLRTRLPLAAGDATSIRASEGRTRLKRSGVSCVAAWMQALTSARTAVVPRHNPTQAGTGSCALTTWTWRARGRQARRLGAPPASTSAHCRCRPHL